MRGVSVQLDVPLHARVMHVVVVHVIAVPPHVPAPHVSVCVQALPSSQRVAVRHCQVPPSLVHVYVTPPHESCWQSVWLDASHECAPPPMHEPAARGAPQPRQLRPIVSRFESH